MVVKAYKLKVGKSYIYIDRWQSDKPETNMGKLLTMGEFRISKNGNHEPSATLIFENGTKVYDWDDRFKEVKTTTSGENARRVAIEKAGN